MGADAPIALKPEFLAEHFVKQLSPFSDPFQHFVNTTVTSFSHSNISETQYNEHIQLHKVLRCIKSTYNSSTGLDNMINLVFRRLSPKFLHYFFCIDSNCGYFLGIV